MENVEQMKVGNLVKMPTGHFWWNGRVGVITEVRMGGFSNSDGDHITREECRVDFGDDFIWYYSKDMEVLNAVS